MDKSIALSRLLQLTSPMLPVGAYSYSQGLEWAIESGVVTDAVSATEWIRDALMVYQTHFELPVLYRLYDAWLHNDMAAVQTWDDYYQAGRDTAEALAETRQMGYSLCRLINDLDTCSTAFIDRVNALEKPAFSTVYAGVAVQWAIQVESVLHGFVWSWLENQVSAAMKTVPLGQVAGQKILLNLGGILPAIVQQAIQLQTDQISNFNPLYTIAGCQHETQYSRLFRS